MHFNDVIGQKIIKKQLINDIKYDTLSHAYIFNGSEGMGKRFMSEVFSQAIMCEEANKSGIACDKCPECIKVKTKNHPDVKMLEDEAAKNLKKEAVEDFFKSVNIKPFASQKKIYIVNNADRMTEEAQNMLLKTIEEPPEYAHIILISEDYQKILPTIKSRCRTLNFVPYSDEDISKILNINIDENKFIIKYSEGVLGIVRRLLGSDEFIELRDSVFDICTKISEVTSHGYALMYLDYFTKNINNIKDILSIMMCIYMDVLKIKKLDKQFIINYDKMKEIEYISAKIDIQRLKRIIKSIVNVNEALSFNVNSNLTMERMVLDMI